MLSHTRDVVRGEQKLVTTLEGAIGRSRPRIDGALVQEIVRVHRWQRMLESGEYTDLTELAAAEKINLVYMSRVLRLTLLAPEEIVEAHWTRSQPKGTFVPALKIKNCCQ